MADTNYTPAQALALLANAQMRPFTKSDWDAFAGCETEHPMIGAVGRCTLIVDGAVLMLLDEGDEGGGQTLTLARGD